MAMPIGYVPSRSGGGVSPEVESALTRLGRDTGKLVSGFFRTIDLPRGYLNSAADYLYDGTWNDPHDPDQNVGGEEWMERAGVTNPTLKFVGGLGLDIITDPLSYMTGGLTQAGRAAATVGRLGDAAEVASRALQKSALADVGQQLVSQKITNSLADAGSRAKAISDYGSTLAPRARRTLESLDTNIEDYIDHASRPLVGQNVARRSTTLDDVIQGADGRTKDALDAFLTKKGWSYDDIKDQQLGKTVGFWLPGVGQASFDPLGAGAGQALSAAVDRVGEAARWSKPGVLAHSVFNKYTGNADDAATQAAAIRINQAADVGEAEGRKTAADLAYDLRQTKIDPAVAQRTGIDNVFDGKAADAIDRYIEGVAATASDIDFVESTPGVKQFVAKWGSKSADILRRSKEMGLNAHQLKHEYGARYRPYQLDATGRESGGRGRTALFDTQTGDMQKRVKALQLPGGIDQLRHYSQDKRFVGLGEAFQEDEIADLLYREINDPSSAYYQNRQGTPAVDSAMRAMVGWKGLPYPVPRIAAKGGKMSGSSGWKGLPYPVPQEYSKSKSRALARFLHEHDPALGPVFGNHPAEAVAKYASGRERAISTADALIDTIASRAVRTAAGQVQGGKHISVGTAINRMGLKAQRVAGSQLRGGAAAQLRERIGKKLGIAPDSVRLAEFSVPEAAVSSLTRLHELYTSPKAQSAIGKAMSEYTKIFKAQVLTWPSRHSRDFLSNAIGNVMVAGARAPIATYHASKLIAGKYDEFLPYLKTLPLYKNVPDDKVVKMFLEDAAASKILGGMSINDVTAGDRAATKLQEVVPGVKPRTLIGSFAGEPGRSTKDALWNSLDIFGARGVSTGNGGKVRLESNNPIFAASDKVGDWSDMVHRLGGWMALLEQGVSPQEASDRIRAVQVAYDSLSPMEKQIRDKFLPFYAYASRSGKFLGTELLTNPGGTTSQTFRALEKTQRSEEDFYMPQKMREKNAIPLSPDLFGSLAAPGPGLRRAISHLDLPGSGTANMFSAVNTGGGMMEDISESIVGTARNMASQTAPQLRKIIEVASNQDMYTGRPLGAVPSAMDQILTAAGQSAGLVGAEDEVRLPRLVNSAIDVVAPGASRVLTTGRQLADPRDPNIASRVATTAWNQIAPFRVSLIDAKRQRGDALRQIDERLSHSPLANNFEKTVIAKEDFEKLPPELQELYLLKQQLEKLNREEKKQRERRISRFTAPGL